MKTLTRLYRCWRSMKDRCQYKDKDVCKEWDKDYISFRDWALANGYSDDKVIHRMNNIPLYSPRTCKWVTKEEHAKIHYGLKKNIKEIMVGR